jgi:hypothetical protein
VRARKDKGAGQGISRMCARPPARESDRMPATITSQPRTLVLHPQRPWRPPAAEPAQPRPFATHRFAAPVVRELPPRRELRFAAATW